MASNDVSRAVQDYAKAIYTLESRADGSSVSTNALAERLAVTAASASGMLRRLSEDGIVEHTPYHGVRLTERGRRVALEVLRHHRLLEAFLVRELGMPWERVHAEAEQLEHVLSEELELLIDKKLGHPTADPHGDPIPDSDYQITEPATSALEALPIGARGRFVRVSDTDPAMLSYLQQLGIGPGDAFEVIDRQPFGGPLMVRFGLITHAIGGGLAGAMRMQVA